MAELAVAGLIASTALSATGQYMAGQEKSRAAAFEREQYNRRAETYRIAAAQDEARRREDLNSTFGTIDAIRAGRGMMSGSPTFAAITADTTAKAERDIRTSRLNLLTKADSDSMSANMADRKSKYSLLAADIGIGETLATSAFRFSNPAFKFSKLG